MRRNEDDDARDASKDFVRSAIKTVSSVPDLLATLFGLLESLFKKRPHVLSAILFILVVLAVCGRLTGVDLLFFVPVGSSPEGGVVGALFKGSTWIENDASLERCTQKAQSLGLAYLVQSLTQFVQYGYEPVVTKRGNSLTTKPLLLRERTYGSIRRLLSKSILLIRLKELLHPGMDRLGKCDRKTNQAILFASTERAVRVSSLKQEQICAIQFRSRRSALPTQMSPWESLDPWDDFWEYDSGDDYVCQLTQIIEAPYLKVRRVTLYKGPAAGGTMKETSADDLIQSEDGKGGSAILATWYNVEPHQKLGIIFEIEDLKDWLFTSVGRTRGSVQQ